MVRRPLGRGLDALIENTALDDAAKPAGRGAARDGQLLLAPVARITPSPFQPRLVFDPERLQELANAIKIQGVLEPLLVRLKPDAPAGGAAEYELIAGERRLRAAKLAGLETVPVIVRELDDRNALEVSLVENLAREQLNPIEEARAFAALNRQFMLSHDTIADRVGKSRPYVTNQIRLLELPEEVVHLVVQGKLTTGQARPLLALPGKQERINAARRIIEGGATSRVAEQLASDLRNARASISGYTRREDPNLTALAENLQRALKRKVRITRRRGKNPGHIELDYYDENDLNALADLLLSAPRTTSAGVA